MPRKLERWPPAAIGYRRAIEILRRPGARMIKMYTHKSPEGYACFVVPGGYVSPETAKKIQEHPQIVASHDALFPGMTQTWRHLNHEQPCG
jgi:hypothetical protein